MSRVTLDAAALTPEYGSWFIMVVFGGGIAVFVTALAISLILERRHRIDHHHRKRSVTIDTGSPVEMKPGKSTPQIRPQR